MMSTQKIRETLPDADKYSDSEIEKITADLEELASILFDKWLQERNVEKQRSCFSHTEV